MGGYSTQPQVRMGSKVGRNICFDSTHGFYSALKKINNIRGPVINTLLLFEKGKTNSIKHKQ
jgi:hypothetical protein